MTNQPATITEIKNFIRETEAQYKGKSFDELMKIYSTAQTMAAANSAEWAIRVFAILKNRAIASH